MGFYAQTHLQLYQQLQDGSYGEDDLLLVDRAYQIAMRLFAGHYRPNNKPFLVHLVGVASILTNIRQPAVLVAAGLLHSAYSLGLRKKGNEVDHKYRNQIVASLGEEVEQLVYEYGNRNWSVGDFRDGEDALQSLTPYSRQLYLIKLADLHEEFLDAGHSYEPRKKLLGDEDANGAWLQDVATRIESLGYESWAQEFRRAVDSNRRNLPDAIRGKASSSYVVAPGFLPDNHLKDRLIRWLTVRLQRL